jgi:hypothetical protein
MPVASRETRTMTLRLRSQTVSALWPLLLFSEFPLGQWMIRFDHSHGQGTCAYIDAAKYC